MSIRSSVGAGGANVPGDVRFVQILLNTALARLESARRLPIDGICGARTEASILRFQRHGVAIRHPSGRIEPGDRTLEYLRDMLPAHLSPGKLHALMPNATEADVCRFHQPLRSGLLAHGIVSALRFAHFFAQIGAESDDLAVVEIATARRPRGIRRRVVLLRPRSYQTCRTRVLRSLQGGARDRYPERTAAAL